MDEYRANYALLKVLERLGPTAEAVDTPWAEYAGDETSQLSFSVPTADAVDAYVELQAFDVGSFGHEILLNGEPLSGFDVPPGDGWQYWMDAVEGDRLQAGENTIRIRRDTETDDAFAVGNLVINWKEPVD